MTCTSWYKLVQACTSPKKLFVKMLMPNLRLAFGVRFLSDLVHGIIGEFSPVSEGTFNLKICVS